MADGSADDGSADRCGVVLSEDECRILASHHTSDTSFYVVSNTDYQGASDSVPPGCFLEFSWMSWMSLTNSYKYNPNLDSSVACSSTYECACGHAPPPPPPPPGSWTSTRGVGVDACPDYAMAPSNAAECFAAVAGMPQLSSTPGKQTNLLSA